MNLYEKHFTVEEARAWLPRLRARFEAVHALYTELEPLRTDFERAMQRIRQNGSAPPSSTFEQKVVEIQGLLQEIVEAGIEIKDVQRGLVDFPCWRDGEEVFLCWELGEDDLEYWHRIEDGYPGRQPL
jgi:hypothetical protein